MMAKLTHIDATGAPKALTMQEWERVASELPPRKAASRAKSMAGTFYGPEGRAPEFDRSMRELRSAYTHVRGPRAGAELQYWTDRGLESRGEQPVDWTPRHDDRRPEEAPACPCGSGV